MPARLAVFIPVFLGTAIAITIAAQCQEYCSNYMDSISSNSCPSCTQQLPTCDKNGWMGQPWSDTPPGGCECGNHRKLTNYNFSSHWPAPFSVVMDYAKGGNHRHRMSDTRNTRLRDKLDALANFRLLAPVRRDNGYCGPDCDPFGHVGQSRRCLDSEVMPEPVERAPEAVPVERLTTIPALPPLPSSIANPSPLRLVELDQPRPNPGMSRLSDRPSVPSQISGSTVLQGHYLMPSVERKVQPVIWESVVEGE